MRYYHKCHGEVNYRNMSHIHFTVVMDLHVQCGLKVLLYEGKSRSIESIGDQQNGSRTQEMT